MSAAQLGGNAEVVGGDNGRRDARGQARTDVGDSGDRGRAQRARSETEEGSGSHLGGEEATEMAIELC